MNVSSIRYIFNKKFKNNEFIIDRTGCKMIEIIGASFIADAPIIFGDFNDEYFQKELAWYYTQSLSIYDLDTIPPQLWQSTADDDGIVNSNYGNLIFSKERHTQYLNVLNELRTNPLSRRAVMVYTRPEMQYEYNENNRNDFICTNAVAYYIRNKKIYAVVEMRSNDAVFGYMYDKAWQEHILQQLCDDLDLSPGTIIWQAQNLHIYERHFNFLKGTKQ